MKDNLQIRAAEKNDVAGILALIHELAVFEKEPDAVHISTDTLLEYGFGSNPLFKCFVAEREEEIIGIALVYFRFSTWEGKTLHLEDLIVTASQRGTGVGKGLYDAVMHFAFTEGVQRVEWVVLDWNKSAIDFYEKSGAVMLKDWYLAQMDASTLEKYVASTTEK